MNDFAERAADAIVSVGFYNHISDVLQSARKHAYAAVNHTMVLAYWEIGRSIVEEQGGEEKARYGEQLIKGLSERLTSDFGKGFTPANLLGV